MTRSIQSPACKAYTHPEPFIQKRTPRQIVRDSR